jgi:hypothetical protein
MILFLDYDGVLHPSEVFRNPKTGLIFLDREFTRGGHSMFEHGDLLGKLLDESCVDVNIVLSTSWVRVLKNFSKAKRYLPDSLQKRVIGATWHSSMSGELGSRDMYSETFTFTSMTRCQQIVQHCERNLIADSDWVSIDDDDTRWSQHLRDNLVHTDKTMGLGKRSTQQELISKLRGEWK